MSASILVATPCSGELVTTEYLHTIVKLIGWSTNPSAGFSVSLLTLALSDLHKARNHLAAAFMAEPNHTHLLFIDADQAFRPALVSRMLKLDQPFVAALCPYRTMDMKRFHELSRRFDDPELAERLSLDFVSAGTLVGERVGDGPPVFRVRDGFIRAKAVGSGIALLKREVFERLRDAHPELWTPPDQPPYSQIGIKDAVHQCFAPLQIEGGNFLSEDMSFCRRWDNLGGQIWVCVDEDIVHVGRKAYRSAYIDRMKHDLFQN